VVPSVVTVLTHPIQDDTQHDQDDYDADKHGTAARSGSTGWAGLTLQERHSVYEPWVLPVARCSIASRSVIWHC
jgi:hypothetical protein